MKPLYKTPTATVDLSGVEREAGLDEEIEGWLALASPAMAAELEQSRRSGDPHRHRKACVRFVGMYARENGAALLWEGSRIGRPVYIVNGEGRGPDELGLDELTKAMTADPSGQMLLQLMRVKKANGGARLVGAE